MGRIQVKVMGSFEPNISKGFDTGEKGHAEVVEEVIVWLAVEVLPKAVEQDQRQSKARRADKEGRGG